MLPMHRRRHILHFVFTAFDISFGIYLFHAHIGHWERDDARTSLHIQTRSETRWKNKCSHLSFSFIIHLVSVWAIGKEWNVPGHLSFFRSIWSFLDIVGRNWRAKQQRQFLSALNRRSVKRVQKCKDRQLTRENDVKSILLLFSIDLFGDEPNATKIHFIE